MKAAERIFSFLTVYIFTVENGGFSFIPICAFHNMLHSFLWCCPVLPEYILINKRHKNVTQYVGSNSLSPVWRDIVKSTLRNSGANH